MPIRPEQRSRYPKDWDAISRRIRERDGNVCKWCAAPSGARICRLRADPAKWAIGLDVEMHFVLALFHDPITVVLTVAHLDHDPPNVEDDNLVALCQRCHLRYDAKHHQRNAADTRARKRDAESGQISLVGRDS